MSIAELPETQPVEVICVVGEQPQQPPQPPISPTLLSIQPCESMAA
jgi:flagellar biosynthesis protein FlhA